jgi:hypothetical protein
MPEFTESDKAEQGPTVPANVEKFDRCDALKADFETRRQVNETQGQVDRLSFR